ncbi:unnamed protein product [Nezara viridula]|uniref:Uncharacterized protein n=1 Tax=Nezara viridula TaxID=85310 RepID=A0A9P0MQS0_NEZVI|nr:unnamed protein product [Nezara viridula]
MGKFAIVRKMSGSFAEVSRFAARLSPYLDKYSHFTFLRPTPLSFSSNVTLSLCGGREYCKAYSMRPALPKEAITDTLSTSAENSSSSIKAKNSSKTSAIRARARIDDARKQSFSIRPLGNNLES